MKKKKKFITATAATAAVAGFSTMIANQEVKADTTNNVNNVTTASETVDPLSTASENLVTATNNLSEAQQIADNASQTNSVAQSQLATASQELVTATSENNSAQAQLSAAQSLKASATSGNIAKARNMVSQDSKNVQQASENVNNMQTNFTNAQTDLTTATAKARAAQTNVDQASNNVGTAQAIVDGTGLTAAENAVTTAQANYDTAKTNADQKQAVLSQAHQTATQAASTTATAESQKATASNSLSVASQALSTASANEYNTAKALTTAQANATSATQAVQAAQEAVDSVNTITLPSGYVAALTAYHNGTGSSDQVKTIGQTGINTNSYKSNSEDASEVVYQYPTNSKSNIVAGNNANIQLTTAQVQELSTFTLSLLNQVWDQVGTSGAVVSAGSITYIEDLISQINSGTQPHGHTTSILGPTSGSYGLGYNEDISFPYLGFFPTSAITMDTLKKNIYDGIIDMLFNDYGSNWGHALSLTDIPNYSVGRTQYLAVDVDKWGDVFFELPTQNSTNAKFNTTTTYTATPDVNELQQTLTNAKNHENETAQALETATTNHNQAQTSLQTAQANYNNAQSALNTTTKALTTAQANQEIAQQAVLTAQKDVDDANGQVEAAQATLNQAKATLATLTADQQTKLANLNAAKQTLADAQNALTSANNDVETKQTAVNNAQTALNQAESVLTATKDQLTTDTNYLTSLLNADSNLAVAQELATQTQTALATATKNYNQAKTTADEEAEVNQLEQDQLAKFQKYYDEALANYEYMVKINTGISEGLASMHGYHVVNGQVVDMDGNVISGWTVSPNGEMVDENGFIINWGGDNETANESEANNSEKPKNLSDTAYPSRQEYQKIHAEGDLPQTGNTNNSIFGLVGASLMAALGAVGLKKKKHD